MMPCSPPQRAVTHVFCNVHDHSLTLTAASYKTSGRSSFTCKYLLLLHQRNTPCSSLHPETLPRFTLYICSRHQRRQVQAWAVRTRSLIELGFEKTQLKSVRQWFITKLTGEFNSKKHISLPEPIDWQLQEWLFRLKCASENDIVILSPCYQQQ